MLLKMLEGRESFAVSIFNTMQDLHASLLAGSKSDLKEHLTGLGFSNRVSNELKAKFVDTVNESAAKLLSYLDLNTGNPSNELFKAARIFDPRQVTALSHDIYKYAGHIKCLNSHNPTILEEWAIYINLAKAEQFAEDFTVISF